ncbi:HEAT repeat domain-containing protein [Streptomyces galbus]|uniref:HEAT repeat domain-containing protein n=1 Tax=Streptomyces galbus TaxID=33898 RepID=UPI0037B27D86
MRRRDVTEVRALLAGGADPDAYDVEGVPVLCLAVAAHHEPLVEALLAAGADPLRRLPDGTTPLLRAVAAGSVPLTETLAGHRVPLPAPDREELLAYARHWADTGAEAGLRRLTGLTGPVTRVRAEDAEVSRWWEEVALGGLTVRDTHLAVLTALEARYGLRTPFDDLVARALAHPDRDHAVWSEVVFTLGRRLDEETWQWSRDLLDHPGRPHRLLGADVLLGLVLGDPMTGRDPFGDRADQLLPWAEQEEDAEVLAVVLDALTHGRSPETEALGLSYVTHPDPRVRALVPDCLERDGRSVARRASLAVVLTLVDDPDPDVRAALCHWLRHYRGPEPEAGDALLALTHDPRQRIRAHAVSGLALRDDPRCVAAEQRIGPVGEDLSGDEVLFDVWRYQERRRRAAGAG